MHLEKSPRIIPKRKFSINFDQITFPILMALGLELSILRDEGFYVWIYTIILGIVILLLYFLSNKLWQRKWSNFAHQYNLKIIEVPKRIDPKIIGTYRGYEINIRLLPGKDIHQGPSTQISLKINTIGKHHMKLSRRKWYQRNPELVGNPKFDKRIKSEDSSTRMLTYLRSQQRTSQGLIELASQAKGFSLSISGNQLAYSELGKIKDLNYLHAVLEFLTDLGRSIERLPEL